MYAGSLFGNLSIYRKQALNSTRCPNKPDGAQFVLNRSQLYCIKVKETENLYSVLLNSGSLRMGKDIEKTDHTHAVC